MVDESVDKQVETTQPIIIDLGKQKAKAIKSLKEGEGKLWGDMMSVIDEVKEMLGEEADGKTIVPVVMIYEKKRKRQRLDKMFFRPLR